MSIRNRAALIGAALGLSAIPAAGQNTNGGADAPADSPVAAKASAGATLSLGSGGAKAKAKGKAKAKAKANGPEDGADMDPPDGHPRALEAENSMTGSTGLLRTFAADSGATGTFRVSLLGSFYSGSNFLCPVCSSADRKQLSRIDDSVGQFGTRGQLSVTPVDFLEAYTALRYQTTSNNQGDPKVIDIVGDMTLGVKAFMPVVPDRIFSFGGALDLLMLSSPGGVGLDAASVGIRAIGTADLTRRAHREDRIPLRIHLNTGYVFDNSGVLADDVEASRAVTLGLKRPGERRRITRIERFGHDISRVDSYRTGLGVEGAFKWVRPFLEWSIDIPVNRQSYECGNSTNRSVGDGCLSAGGFAEVPSRLTLGAHVYPWVAPWLDGLAFLAAVDIGTGATSSPIEEVAPQLPWTVHLGLAYAVDVAPRGAATVVEKIVERAAPPPPPEHHIEGVVLRTGGKEEPVPGAIIHYVGRPFTGMVADDQGKFSSASLDPGAFKFAVTAEGYRDGECAATIPIDPRPVAPKPPKPRRDGKTPAAPPPPPPPGPVIVRVRCELEALPRTATITGVLRDADTTTFIDAGTVTITDPLGRQLALKTDAEGTFRFGNVPAGKSKLTAEADGYLRAAVDVTLEPRKDVSMDIVVHKRPALSNVVITKNEIKLKKDVHFQHGSAEILPDSMSILEEAADAIRTHQGLGTVEIQGHTDDTGTPDVNLRLSADRANAVRDVFVKNGVDPSALTTHGYGQEKPLVPNTSPKARAKNRRVQLLIVK
jgi:outer membrane protein OmpA-like peptidoglycan-associated protein